MSDQLAAMEQATAFKQAGFDELANQTLAKYGLDSTMLDAWQGMSDTTKEQMAALLQGASLAGSGNDTGAKSYLQMAGIDPGSTDYYSTIAGRQNASALALAQQKSAITGTGRSSGSSRSSSSGSKTGSSGFTNSQLMSMSKAFKGMTSTDPMYSFYKKTLTDAGWLTDSRLEYGQNVVNQSIASGKSQNEIMNQLMNQGFTDEEIARFFNNAE